MHLKSKPNCKIEPPISINKSDGGDFDGSRSLTAIYIEGNCKHEIDCKSSICNTYYLFTSEKFGHVKFDKRTELFLESSISIDRNYFLFLKRFILTWKRHFSYM
jgi:hypothetical protein